VSYMCKLYKNITNLFKDCCYALQHSYMNTVHCVYKSLNLYLCFQDLELEVEQSCQAGKEFSQLYYDTVDKKRHVSYITIHPIKKRCVICICFWIFVIIPC